MISKHHFSEDFRKIMVTKLLQPKGPSVLELANKQGISKTTLYNWLKKHSSVGDNNNMSVKTVNNTTYNYKTAAGKLKAIIDTNNLTEEEIGVYCRKNGIYAADLPKWKQQCLNNFEPTITKDEYKEYRQKYLNLEKDYNKLKSELNRNNKALAEASALLVLQKKANLIWGDHQDD